MSVITYIELVQGCRSGQELALLRTDLSRRGAVILPITQTISERSVALIEAHALADGLRLADALIAATALELGEAICTANAKHFKPVAGLTVERFEP